MSLSATLTSSSSQTPAPSSTSDPLPGDDGNEDQASVWKRRYHALQEELNAQKSAKRKAGSVNLIDICNPQTEYTAIRNTTSTSQLGRGIRKVAFICGEIKDIVSDSDKHCAYLEDPDDLDLKNELEELDNDDEVEELKREYAALFVFVIVEV